MTDIEGIFSFIDSLTPEQNIKVGEIVEEARADERAKVIEEVEKMKKTDKFPQSLTTYDGKTKYFDRLSDGDLHYNQAISDVLNQLKGITI